MYYIMLLIKTKLIDAILNTYQVYLSETSKDRKKKKIIKIKETKRINTFMN